MSSASEAICPCGSGNRYPDCCGPIHRSGAGFGTTAEALMRSRYTAYVLEERPFLLSSWHTDTRPPTVTFSPDQEWLGLEIVAVERGGPLDTEGSVEFIARFRHGADYFELHELSTFERVDGSWLYVSGSDPNSAI